MERNKDIQEVTEERDEYGRTLQQQYDGFVVTGQPRLDTLDQLKAELCKMLKRGKKHHRLKALKFLLIHQNKTTHGKVSSTNS